MVPLKHPVIFVRGLNTSGEESVFSGRWSSKTPMHGPWVNYFSSKGSKIYPLIGLGAAPLPEMLDRALEKMKSLNFLGPVHLLGHSAGGLLVRGLASELGPERVLSVSTLASPHDGATIAEQFLEKVQHDKITRSLVRVLGYDERPKIPIINNFAREFVRNYTKSLIISSEIATMSYQFSLPEDQMSWIVRSAHLAGFRPQANEHDGYVEKESQAFGTVVEHFALDHLSQIGYHLYLSPKLKAKKKLLFGQLTEKVYRELLFIENQKYSV